MSVINRIYNRIESKKIDYDYYKFTQNETTALMTFFDLAQEFEVIEEFYHLCVAVPKSFFNLRARLYVRDFESSTHFLLKAQTEIGERELNTSLTDEMQHIEKLTYKDDGSLFLPIRGKSDLIHQLPVQSKDIIGLLEVYKVSRQDMHNELFFEKYANRIGFNMHNKFLALKNIEHLNFIRSLVADIEHNVIIPNIAYKLFLRRLKGKISKNKEIEKLLYDHLNSIHDDKMEKLSQDLSEVNTGLSEEIENIEKHYKNMSLFIETLFRRSHFDEGKLLLRTKACNMKKDVIQPQLERYRVQIEKAGISIEDYLSIIPDEDIISVVDPGLMAQVFANLFSNALKYTQTVVTDTGEEKKYITYGRETMKDFFGKEKDGIKYNVFSTGHHVPPEDREKIFEDGYRAKNALTKPGTGHGLNFIKKAVEIHEGVVGYEAKKYGNNFYFIIPKP